MERKSFTTELMKRFQKARFGPLGHENLIFPKSSAENISKRKYTMNFIFEHNVCVIEVHLYDFLGPFQEIFQIYMAKT